MVRESPSPQNLSFREEPFAAIANMAQDRDMPYDRYLLAVDAGALTSERPSACDLLDFQVGHRTRGYILDEETDHRWLLLGVGRSVANVPRAWRVPGAASFDHFQLPWVSTRIGYDLNEGDTEWLWGS